MNHRQKHLSACLIALAALLSLAPIQGAWAGSPHFVVVNVTQTDNTLTVSGKEAGLGNEASVHIVVTADAECINPGGNHPKAANKMSVSAGDYFPVQNGKALFDLTVTATFQPECSPPMTVVFSNIKVCDTTNDVCF